MLRFLAGIKTRGDFRIPVTKRTVKKIVLQNLQKPQMLLLCYKR